MNRFNGVFSNVTDAVYAAKHSFERYCKFSLNDRKEIICFLRKELLNNVDTLAEMSFRETGMGVVEDKKTKIRLAIEQTPGVEDLITEARTGDGGMTLLTNAPYGVVCAIEASNNPCATMINNTISLLSAGNTIVNCPHPRTIETAKYLTDIINNLILDICGLENMVVTLRECRLNDINEIMNHPDIDMIVSTGGSDNARAAISCGKKVIAAGPANPTFIVDETADIGRAAYCISRGASFDNNIMCITEKNIIVVKSICDLLKEELQKNGVYYVDSMLEMLKLSKLLLTEDMKPNKVFGGKDANEILERAGIQTEKQYKLIAVETVKIHPFVTEELLVPLITVIKAEKFEEALDIAVAVEQNLRHTSGIHSNRMERLRIAECCLKTSIFIKNGCSLDGIGICGVGGTGFTVANISGEGIVTAKDFSRKRRCVSVDKLFIG